MNRMRLKIAQRLKESQNTTAMLTTFNEVDMSSVMSLRKENQASFISVGVWLKPYWILVFYLSRVKVQLNSLGRSSSGSNDRNSSPSTFGHFLTYKSYVMCGGGNSKKLSI